VRRFGIEPRSAVEQAQHDRPTGAEEPFEALPTPTGEAPYRLALSSVKPTQAEQCVFHVIGDHGGVKDPTPQLAVAKALAADAGPSLVDFCYSVGDISYFNGAEVEYGPQFYEAYADYNVPIFAIPGNHDGDPEQDGEPSLQAFMENFCASSPALPAKWAEFNRDTMDQPNCYWTLQDELVTIIGLYTNVPSGGVVKADQEAWLIGELKAAPTDRALALALHHPPLSCDAHHGGSKEMGELIERACKAAGRWPDIIMAGHVHNWQRFTWTVTLPDGSTKDIACIVCGAGGYHNLHAMASDAVPGLQATSDCVLEAFDATQYGFLRLAVTAGEITGEYIGVSREGVVTENVDSFTVPVSAAGA